MNTILLTVFAMIAFAANSVLCRLALLEGDIDAGSFTFIRIVSGALTLCLLRYGFVRDEISVSVKSKASVPQDSPDEPTTLRQKFYLALSLTGYALSFSYAYVELGTGTGALILFGTVQLSMLLVYALKGNRVRALEWLGLALAIGGFLYLLLPGATQPDTGAALLMALSGICWAAFTLLGKGSGKPLNSITTGFIGGSLLMLAVSPWVISSEDVTFQGLLLAVASGSVTSALGYVIWYMALRELSLLTASVVQLSVPALAAAGGILFVGESLVIQEVFAAALVLGGIATIFTSQQKLTSQEKN